MPRRSRREKYPDTKYFTYYNANPRNRITGDCVFRAFSFALGIPYNKCVMEMAETMCETGYSLNDKKGIERFLTKKGWIKHPQLRHPDGTKYTVKDFIDTHKTGTYILSMAHHETVVKDGKNYDIWDCVRCGGVVGNYWTAS
jgi:hypothetical protein